MEFKKKPITIEATQWFRNGDHPKDQIHQIAGGLGVDFESEGKIVRRYRHPDVAGDSRCKHCGQIMFVHGWIDTLDGGHTVCPGDWIITGVEEQIYPCKDSIFKKTYDLIPD